LAGDATGGTTVTSKPDGPENSAPRVEIHDNETVKSLSVLEPARSVVNPAIANAPTIQGSAALAVQDEARNLDLAVATASRLFGLGGVANIDIADPIVGRVVSDTIVAIKKLGAGGMGAVYLAVDTQENLHDRKYALKVTATSISADDRERFKREVSAAARIRSRRVVEVHRHGTFRDQRLWMLMDYVDGVSLESEIAKHGIFSIDRALSRVGLGLVRAVAEVHANKIIHKDLKPSNVMLEGDDIKLLDFGIARVGGGDESVFKTNPNMAGGTPGYWSPESVIGQAVDYRTDVWSIGVILFEMLTGDLPFGKPHNTPDMHAQIAAMMSQPAPSLNDIRQKKRLPPVSRAVESLIADCLHKEIMKRLTLTSLHERLKAAVEEHAKSAGIPNPMLTMRSEAQLLDLPSKLHTSAKTSEAAVVAAMLGQFASSGSTLASAPAARRRAAAIPNGLTMKGALVAILVLIVAAAVVLTAILWRPSHAPAGDWVPPSSPRPSSSATVAPAAALSPPPPRPPLPSAQVASPAPTPQHSAKAPGRPRGHRKEPPAERAPKSAPNTDENGPVNPF
jgi:serine/threonine protein kinase